MSDNDDTRICYLSATRLIELYERETLSPLEVTKAVLARIDQVNGVVNAFCHVDEEAALVAARESEERWMKGEPKGLIDGIPVSIKDNQLVKGQVIGRGSKLTQDNPPERFDSPAVARLRERGAVILGRTTTPEFGWKGVTDSPLTGTTRNPWNITKTPGGSSGGAAVAAALGMGALHTGTDGGGSIRIPAGFTGVFGLKPTYGRVPVFPESAMGTLSHLGPITRTVEDAAMMMNVIVQPDPRDCTALPYDPLDFRTVLGLGVRHLKVAFSPNLGFVDVDPEIAAIVSDAVKALEEQGAIVEEVDPGFGDPQDMFQKLWYGGAARSLDKLPEDRRHEMDPGLVEIAEAGRRYSLNDYMDAITARTVLGCKMSLFHETYDLLVTPTLPIAAFETDAEVADPTTQKRWMDWTPFTYPFNLTGQPVATVPCGFTKAGLPVGMQIIGPRYADALVMRAASAFEQVRPFVMPDGPKGG